MKFSRIICSVMALIFIISVMCGCSSLKIEYDNAEKYTAGNNTINDEVETIEIEWISGNINLLSHEENYLSIVEDSESLDEEKQVHWWLDNTTLRIRYSAPGNYMMTLDKLLNLEKKDLTIYIPQSLTVKKISISQSTGDINLGTVKITDLSINSISGAIVLNCDAENIDIKSTSGNIEINQETPAKTVNVNSTSGNSDIRYAEVGEITIEATSGKTSLSAEKVGKVNISKISGATECSFDEILTECVINATSGDIKIEVPETLGFTAKVSKTTGDFNSDFELEKGNDTCVNGDGMAKIDISVTSGDISITAKQEISNN
ncbi:MAG: DUF4097 family beta strand repeat protein [Clostridia bacterium]|nr:DUF4097 family beta strand repeat protein [Clostridia bacterium]